MTSGMAGWRLLLLPELNWVAGAVSSTASWLGPLLKLGAGPACKQM